MSVLVAIVILVAVFGGAIFILNAINILQNGRRSWDGRGVKEILGKPASEATAEDIFSLSKREVIQLFYAAEAPEFSRMKGEYQAKNIPVGVLAFANNFYTHHLMGPGHWERKAFFPFGDKDKKAWGYNIFRSGRGSKSRIIRTMKMDTFIGRSRFDKKDSFHLVYKAYNRGRNHSMRDEIRMINDKLFIALGCLKWNLDKLNPSPFILVGEPEPWAGPDEK